MVISSRPFAGTWLVGKVLVQASAVADTASPPRRPHMKTLTVLLLVASVLVCPIMSSAQWQLDGVNLSPAANGQIAPTIVSDGAGGAIVTWCDGRGSSYDIFAQRINASGAAVWTTAGVAICTAANDQLYPAIAPDGAGGAIVTWWDSRSGNYDIYAQRINASGAVLWAANGVVICNAVNTQQYPVIVSDGAAGAIVAWQDNRSGDNDIYVQRVNASGAVQWTANGVPIGSAINDQSSPALVADGAGGAIVTWQDSRSGNYDIYAERINGTGSILWIFPTVVCGAGANQLSPTIASDGGANTVITWMDNRNGNSDIFAQSLNASGVTQWVANGVSVCTAANAQNTPTIVSDGAGGAIVTWYDFRNGANNDIYAQRVGILGSALWTADGVPLSTATGAQQNPVLVADGAGGAIVAWEDIRNGSFDIYAQRVNAAGAVQWTTDGMAVCAASNTQNAVKIVGDGAGGAIVTWQDGRSGGLDVFAQRVENRYGYWGRPEPTLDTVSDNKHDQGGKVVLNWRPSGRDVLNQQTIYLYSIWRALDVASAQALVTSGTASVIDAPSARKRNAAGRTLWLERSPQTSYYWELIGSVPANYSDAYSYLASTRQDSVATNPGTTFFRVVAESYSQFVNWPSNVVSGHSVDNLAPAAPLFLTAQRVGADVHLKWNRVRVPDLKNYSVYRASASGVTPIPTNFLATDTDTLLVDAGAPTGTLYYIVTAYDAHANQSAPSNEASVGTSTHVGDLPPISRLTVLQNYPNPFAGTTELQVGLPSSQAITVRVFDVAGRRVREFETSGVKGWQQLALTGVDARGTPLASGVYFYRISAGGETLTRKMVIAR